MLAVIYILMFIVGIVVGFVSCLAIMTRHYYGGEIVLNEEKMYADDWVCNYDDGRRYALIKINRGDSN